MPEITLDVYKAMVGQEVGVSRWLEVPQKRIDAFADVTEDHQFIHVDPERTKATPFGGTVAHGFLTMSLLAPMAFDAQPTLAGTVMVVNYGFRPAATHRSSPRGEPDPCRKSRFLLRLRQSLHLPRSDTVGRSEGANGCPLPALADAPAESHEAGRQRPDDGHLRQQDEVREPGHRSLGVALRRAVSAQPAQIAVSSALFAAAAT
jgi:hypothetical protein